MFVAISGWDATREAFEGKTGRAVFTARVFPARGTKQAGCGRGVLQTKQVGRGRDAELRKIPYDIVIKMCNSAEVI